MFSDHFCTDSTRPRTYVNRRQKGKTSRFEVCLPAKFVLQKGSPVFTAEQYRAKAAEYADLVRAANGADEVREFQRIERSFAELADNAQWVTDNRDKTMPPAQNAQQQ
jgi:hypothetical protein